MNEKDRSDFIIRKDICRHDPIAISSTQISDHAYESVIPDICIISLEK